MKESIAMGEGWIAFSSESIKPCGDVEKNKSIKVTNASSNALKIIDNSKMWLLRYQDKKWMIYTNNNAGVKDSMFGSNGQSTQKESYVTLMIHRSDLRGEFNAVAMSLFNAVLNQQGTGNKNHARDNFRIVCCNSSDTGALKDEDSFVASSVDIFGGVLLKEVVIDMGGNCRITFDAKSYRTTLSEIVVEDVISYDNMPEHEVDM